MENDCESVELEINDEKLINRAVLLLKGFADPTRFKILCLLKEQEVCVHQIVDAFDISQSAISHQLRILRDARLVISRKKGRHVYYKLADQHILDMLQDSLSHSNEHL